MAQNDLTTLASVRQWAAAGAQTNNDAIAMRLISQASDILRAYLNRSSLLSRSYTEMFDGLGGCAQMLTNFPVTAIAAVTTSGITIPANPSPPTGAGYWLDTWDGTPPGGNQRVFLSGYNFPRGRGNVTITYTAGYREQNEAQTVSSDLYQATPLGSNGICARDEGVTYANGTPLASVTANPTVGQYIPPDPLNQTGPRDYYQFAAGDASVPVLISYSYIPFAIESACRNMVGERLSYRERIGQSTKSIGGVETVSYTMKDIPDFDKMSLASYRRLVPI